MSIYKIKGYLKIGTVESQAECFKRAQIKAKHIMLVYPEYTKIEIIRDGNVLETYVDSTGGN